MQFNKKKFLEDLDSILRSGYGCTDKNANVKQLYNAVSMSVTSNLHDIWERNRDGKKKRGGYISAEFLVGRAIFSNLFNLGILEEVRDALAERGIDINDFEEVEDCALGNGGLGRLAACYLESAASHKIPLDGYGLRYRYGLFKQSFVDGFQNEVGDDWQKWGDPWSIRREEESKIINFKDFSVRAVPYDMPIIGYKNDNINTLRLWQAEPVENFNFTEFDNMRCETIAKNNYRAASITDVLYPNDNTKEGKFLRLRQQYFMVSATMQDIIDKHIAKGRRLGDLPRYHVMQLNDTHPTLAIPETIRILREHGLPFAKAFHICQKLFNFTNHTILAEALETWGGDMVRKIIPEIWKVIVLIQKHLDKKGLDPNRYYIIRDGRVHMANLAVYTSEHVNGVAEIHTGILKAQTFRDWYELFPEKFINVTNGITPRRWFLLNNPKMAAEITKRIGNEWETDLSKIADAKQFVNDKDFRDAFVAIKNENKEKLANYIRKHEGVDIPTHFIFDIQIKRLHEYKRQLMNALSILHIYYGIKEGWIKDFKPTAFIFGAKSAPGYYNAKAIIKFINEISKMVNNDPAVADKLRVVFVQNYNVSYAEKLVAAADVSEQISLAGMEASGTGNMKFMLNGTVTLGTMDGANIEICEEAGRENNYIFGLSVEEVRQVKSWYNPRRYAEEHWEVLRLVDTMVNGTFSDGGKGTLQNLYNSLFYNWEPDNYLVLYDLADYIRAKLLVNSEYGTEEFITKSLMNMVSAGKFSSDRSIKDYRDNIWHI